MPFDLANSQPAIAPGFKLKESKPALAPDYVSREEHAARIPALEAERAALPPPIANPIAGAQRYGQDWLNEINRAGHAGEPFDFPDVGEVAMGIGSQLVSPIPALATNKPQEDFVYQPRDVGAQRAIEQIGAVTKPIGDYFSTAIPAAGEAAATTLGASSDVAKKVGEKTGLVGQSIAGMLGARAGLVKGAPPVARPGLTSAGTRGAQAGRKATPVTEKLPQGGHGVLGLARSLGFKMRPSQAAIQPERIGMSHSGLTRQRLAGPGVTQRFQVENQKVANRNSALEVNLDPNKPLAAQIAPELEKFNTLSQRVADSIPEFVPDEEFVSGVNELGKRVRDNPALENAPGIERLRDRLTNIDKMTGQQMLDAIREWRHDAGVLFKSLDDPNKIHQARTMRDAADLMEGSLERQAGEPKLIAQWRKERVRAAKLHNIKDALIGDNVDIAVLKNVGADKLSGRLKDMARIAEEFPQETRTQSHINAESGAVSIAFSPAKLTGQRILGRRITERLLSDEFQNQYGAERLPDNGIASALEQPEPPTAVQQGEFFGPGLDLANPEGAAGGALPSDARRLATQVGPQSDAIGSLLDLANPEGAAGGALPSNARRLATQVGPQSDAIGSLLDLEGEGTAGGPLPSRLRDPEQAPSMFSESLPIDLEPPPGRVGQRGDRRAASSVDRGAKERRSSVGRRLAPSVDRGAEERRASIIAERQAVLDRPIGTRPNAGIADQLLTDPLMRQAVQEDTLANRAELNPGEQLPVGGPEPGVTSGPIVPETGEFERRRNIPEPPISEIGLFRANADIGDMIGNERVRPTQGEVTFTREDLQALGFSDEEIAQLLGEG